MIIPLVISSVIVYYWPTPNIKEGFRPRLGDNKEKVEALLKVWYN